MTQLLITKDEVVRTTRRAECAAEQARSMQRLAVRLASNPEELAMSETTLEQVFDDAVRSDQNAAELLREQYAAMADAGVVDEELAAHDAFVASSTKRRCERCAGTGAFVTYVENGVPKGPGGICFRCGGKGYQTDGDQRRNWGYDNYGVRVSF